jgi:hypothetical protein
MLFIKTVWAMCCLFFLPATHSFTAIRSFLGHGNHGNLGAMPFTSYGPPSIASFEMRRQSAPRVLALRAVVFEPVVPNMAQTAVVLLSTVGLASYWWLVFVPSERRDLAKNKNKGGLNNYLEELEASSGRELERWFYTEWLQRRRKVRMLAEKSKGGLNEVIEQEIENAIPTPSFFSLDNPVLVAVLIMMSGVVFAGISGR